MKYVILLAVLNKVLSLPRVILGSRIYSLSDCAVLSTDRENSFEGFGLLTQHNQIGGDETLYFEWFVDGGGSPAVMRGRDEVARHRKLVRVDALSPPHQQIIFVL